VTHTSESYRNLFAQEN